uniref:(northern house mosquito) hypothetical protein n=1 Tax=Culex pipiens TaxID=7175 RepID=A0A8D8GFP0_CULPI
MCLGTNMMLASPVVLASRTPLRPWAASGDDHDCDDAAGDSSFSAIAHLFCHLCLRRPRDLELVQFFCFLLLILINIKSLTLMLLLFFTSANHCLLLSWRR